MKKINNAIYKLERILLKLNEKYEFYKKNEKLFKQLDKTYGYLTREIEKLEIKLLFKEIRYAKKICSSK